VQALPAIGAKAKVADTEAATIFLIIFCFTDISLLNTSI
jgi:hypothetical protein